ncbi:unnamed protein product [Spirodela intermedia]|uniref:Uncharacterized protein n=1 Tax=Spirodela intermedia TaxID=51605 RepID=A0A7I8KUZ7_SPIIN|nr:unnamed protein product [Spirodela intermedia]
MRCQSFGKKANSSDKYPQVVSPDSHQFWFIMGIVNYDGGVKNPQEAIPVAQRRSCCCCCGCGDPAF